MKCKNCGASLKDNAIRCPNCGAFQDEEEGYVLLASNEHVDDSYYEEMEAEQKRKNRKKGTIAVVVILVIAILASGGLFYYNFIYDKPLNQPTLSFTPGTGIINDDEKVIYVSIIPDNTSSSIEYIHGVSLYAYDKTQKEHEVITETDPVSTDYQYTKGIDDSFRAIFFDTKDLKLKEDTDYTYTFEMKISFVGSNNIYTYTQLVKFNSEIVDDASSIVFDHSLDKEEEPTTEMQKTTAKGAATTTTTTTTTTAASSDFILDGYWYTAPFSEGESYSISAFKFKNDNTFTSTDYQKNGASNWTTTTSNGTYLVDDEVLVVTYSNGESTSFDIDINSKAISDLEKRSYNSLKNAEDFFGL